MFAIVIGKRNKIATQKLTAAQKAKKYSKKKTHAELLPSENILVTLNEKFSNKCILGISTIEGYLKIIMTSHINLLIVKLVFERNNIDCVYNEDSHSLRVKGSLNIFLEKIKALPIINPLQEQSTLPGAVNQTKSSSSQILSSLQQSNQYDYPILPMYESAIGPSSTVAPQVRYVKPPTETVRPQTPIEQDMYEFSKHKHSCCSIQ